MSGKRIVEETPCEHGRTENHQWGEDWEQFPETPYSCPGGSRRTLTEGQYVLIEKVGGEWPKWALQEAENFVYPDDILDALSDHTEGTP